MSGLVWSKFFWSDWEGDPRLRLCSAAAQGLWMRMLCVCAQSDPTGYLMLAGRALGPQDLAAITGWPQHDVERWLDELARWEVYSIDASGRIFSRRMVADAKKAAIARENGRGGGNPNLKGDTEKTKESAASDNQKPTEATTPALSPISHKPLPIQDANASLSPEGDDAPSSRQYPEPFEAAWKAYPHIRGRSSKPKALGLWRRLPAHVRAALPAAVARYAREGREPRMDCGAPGMDRWLRDAKYEDWMAAEQPRPASAVPLTPEIEAWRLRRYRDTGEWREGWGPKPAEPRGAAA
jgi:hypothetical protein